MVARSVLLRPLRAARLVAQPVRLLHAQNSQQKAAPQPKSWLTHKVESSPGAMKAFLRFTNFLGYGSPKQLAGRRAFALYDQVCAVTPDADKDFWQNACRLPPTFQSWFTVTNLHIWLLTVRLRSLPSPLGKIYTQALIDHFFIDVEDRIRAVLQPPSSPSAPYTFHTSFYVNPNAPSNTKDDKKRGRAPDRLVTRQMKIFKEQWAGMGLALDLGLVKGDEELAGAVWRNLLGARGAQGIAFPTTPTSPSSPSPIRRHLNLSGGEIVNPAKVDYAAESTTDDGSGVYDFPPSQADLYLEYPGLMLDIVGYVRREAQRLERVSDAEVMEGSVAKVMFGRVRD
ncbi:hypothetical protein DXG03_009484 [Asterophora parasitica]|uniref:Ubiquinol-cytochrome c chaperone domain-containing protein n=1 Tax=Asterophora parasitica TaxID=117018 RepID=A0A9P7GAZ5_9AGAR|nr:hypothetical protein DXG03_009484 [Asterophora parasitica]